jgi:hypothetical protein
VFRRIIALACLLGSVRPGAGKVVADPGECPGVCERPISYTLDAGFDPDQRALVEQAMHVWERGTGGRVCFAQGGRDLVIQKVGRPEDLEPWDADWSQHIALSKAGHIWIVDDSVSDAGTFRALLMHEIGHHLGLGHVEDTPMSYMHSRVNDTPEELRVHPRLPERDGRDFCAEHRCICAP